jgi:hypothetical protein
MSERGGPDLRNRSHISYESKIKIFFIRRALDEYQTCINLNPRISSLLSAPCVFYPVGPCLY